MPVELGDERLNKRYWKLVQAHMNHTQANAAGPAVPACSASSFAATQATWRFLNNERVTPQELIKPICAFAKIQLHESMVLQGSPVAGVPGSTATGVPGEGFVLLVSDWCKLKYTHHAAKKDVLPVSQQSFRRTIDVEIRGRKGFQEIAETTGEQKNCLTSLRDTGLMAKNKRSPASRLRCDS